MRLQGLPLADAKPAHALILVGVSLMASVHVGGWLEAGRIDWIIADDGPPGPPFVGVSWLLPPAVALFVASVALAATVDLQQARRRPTPDATGPSWRKAWRDTLWWGAILCATVGIVLCVAGLVYRVEWYNEFVRPTELNSSWGPLFLVGSSMLGFYLLWLCVGAFLEGSPTSANRTMAR